MRRLVLPIGLLVLVALPSVVHAQSPEQKVFLRPMVGAVVGSGPGASFSAAVSFKANDKLQIHGELGRLANILPDSVADEVEIAAAAAANTLGGKHSASSTAHANYGLVGVRRALRDVSGANTFLEIGVGVARVTSEVSAVIRGSASLQGDISSSVSTSFTRATPETKPMVSLGGGIILGVTRMTAVEMGARYVRIFTDEKAINMSNIFGGFRFGF
jgi:hypothetical protein